MAKIPFDADLSGLRKGMNDAGKLVKGAFNPKVLGPFSRGLAGLVGGLTSVRGILNAIAGAYVLRQGARAVMETVRASRALEDAWVRVGNAMGAGFSQERLAEAKKFAEQLGLATGQTREQLATTFARFQGSGASDVQSRDMTRLSADVAAQFRVSMDRAAKLVQDASEGRLDGLREIGISLQRSGDTQRDAVRALEQLRERTDGAVAAITNPSERLAATWEDIKADVGTLITPNVDSALTAVSDALTGWKATTMAEDVKVIRDDVAGALKALGMVSSGVGVGVRHGQNQLTGAFNLGETALLSFNAASRGDIGGAWDMGMRGKKVSEELLGPTWRSNADMLLAAFGEGDSGRIGAWIDEKADVGAKKREAAAAAQGNELGAAGLVRAQPAAGAGAAKLSGPGVHAGGQLSVTMRVVGPTSSIRKSR
jgi:hypothetical protein